MKYGLTREQFDFINTEVIQPIQKQGGRVFVYGSRARGDYKKFSDLDLMVESQSKIPLGAIQEKLETGNFPLKVDLVWYGDFAESYKPGYQKDKAPWEI